MRKLTLRSQDGRVICEQVEVADRLLARTRGLLGRRSLDRGTGITLRPAWSIHTGFMRFPIDVVFLDEALVVRRIDATLRPFRIVSWKGAHEVVELAAGECAARGLAVGDGLIWEPAASGTAAGR